MTHSAKIQKIAKMILSKLKFFWTAESRYMKIYFSNKTANITNWPVYNHLELSARPSQKSRGKSLLCANAAVAWNKWPL